MKYVSDLPDMDQQEIVQKIRVRLDEEGYSVEEINQAVRDALDSKLDDIEYLLK